MIHFADLSRVPIPPTPPQWRRYLQTVIHLRPKQAVRLFARRVVSRIIPRGLESIEFTPELRGDWVRRAPFLDDPAARSFRPECRSLILLQIERNLGNPIDWAPAEAPLLWQLEMNYFHWMPGDLPWSAARPWILDWLQYAPRNQRTMCWSPYGVAQRVLRWTRLIHGPWREAIREDPAFPTLLRELYGQCRFLAGHQEKELLGNHLMKTAVALYAGGRFFAGQEADAWLQEATRIIRNEIQTQVLADGGHYERSPMYHLMVLVDLVDAFNITPQGDVFEELLLPPIERMHRFAAICTHGDGEIPLFNDSVFDQAPPRIEVLRYAERVCGISPVHGHSQFVALPEFGLFRLGDQSSCLWLDAGDTGPSFLQAHAHADTGSFELSVGSYRVVCDSGVYSYQDPDCRTWDRSTPAHNTVSVSGENSSDCWGSFRVARRARIRELNWSAQDDQQVVAFRHDGFRHLPASPWHERTVTFHTGSYTIRDRIGARRMRGVRYDGMLYIGPDISIHQLGPGTQTGGSCRTRSFELQNELEPSMRLRLDVTILGNTADSAIFVEPAEFAPRFHTRVAGQRIRAAAVASTVELVLEWRLSL